MTLAVVTFGVVMMAWIGLVIVVDQRARREDRALVAAGGKGVQEVAESPAQAEHVASTDRDAVQRGLRAYYSVVEAPAQTSWRHFEERRFEAGPRITPVLDSWAHEIEALEAEEMHRSISHVLKRGGRLSATRPQEFNEAIVRMAIADETAKRHLATARRAILQPSSVEYLAREAPRLRQAVWRYTSPLHGLLVIEGLSRQIGSILLFNRDYEQRHWDRQLTRLEHRLRALELMMGILQNDPGYPSEDDVRAMELLLRELEE